jgi:UDP-N-acetylmuramoyl-L-alanyl-D-glutamate--2,6-diaminopimelate ligase
MGNKMKRLQLPKIYPVTCHTDHVGPGSTFVAIPGFAENGIQYIEHAKKLGATTIISHVESPRKVLAELSSAALGNPAKELKLIGITGTKGKTTTTYLIDYILQFAGHKTALLGTIKNKILDMEEESARTTPSSDYLQMFFAESVKYNVEYVVMEVSSHSLSLDRTYGLNFDAVGFTNLAPEHLDFYQTMENYYLAKKQIFAQVKENGAVVINLDNDWGQSALTDANEINKAKTLPYALNQNLKIIKNEISGLEFEITLPNNNKIYLTTKKMFGLFNIYNIAMASLICHQLGISTDSIQKAIAEFSGVPGRLQVHHLKNKALAFVDYAHNPSSFEQVLKTLRPLTNDLIVVFGCGGDRDKTKRPVMGKLAVDFCDKVFVTDDNPRTENSQTIATEILSGIPQKHLSKIVTELDRRKAIKMAAESSTAKSIIAILGKGHENYHIVGNQKFHLDDLEEISKF